VSKFFKWQLSNKTKLESSNSLFSFNNIEFSKKYSYKDQLDYVFFLKQGRPFFAYYNFVTYQMNKYGKIYKTLWGDKIIKS